MTSSSIALLACLALAPAGDSAAARAEVHADQADQLYAQGFFSEASAAFATAFETDPDPVYLYGWAQSERRAGNCPRAVELYREYAQLDVSDAAIEAAEKNARRCGGSLQAPSGVAFEPGPAPPPPPPVPPDDRAASPPWYRDRLGWSLVGSGVALGIVATGVGISSAVQRTRADDADLEVDYARATERADRRSTAAIVIGSVGGLLTVAGIVRWAIVAARTPSAPRDAARRSAGSSHGALRSRAPARIATRLGGLVVRF